MEQLHTLLAQPLSTTNTSGLQAMLSQAQVPLIAPDVHHLVFCRVPHTQQHKLNKEAVPLFKEQLSPDIPTLTQKLTSQFQQPTTIL